jgi:hypothetical protein
MEGRKKGEAQAFGNAIRAVAEMGEIHGDVLAFICREYYNTFKRRGQDRRGNLHNSSYIFKFGFVGEYGRTPKRNFLKEVPLWTLFKNFQKGIHYQCFLKVFGVLRTFLQKGSKPPEAVLPLPYKLQFTTPSQFCQTLFLDFPV